MTVPDFPAAPDGIVVGTGHSIGLPGRGPKPRVAHAGTKKGEARKPPPSRSLATRSMAFRYLPIIGLTPDGALADLQELPPA